MRGQMMVALMNNNDVIKKGRPFIVQIDEGHGTLQYIGSFESTSRILTGAYLFPRT